jgi:hypothetical protein
MHLPQTQSRNFVDNSCVSVVQIVVPLPGRLYRSASGLRDALLHNELQLGRERLWLWPDGAIASHLPGGLRKVSTVLTKDSECHGRSGGSAERYGLVALSCRRGVTSRLISQSFSSP